MGSPSGRKRRDEVKADSKEIGELGPRGFPQLTQQEHGGVDRGRARQLRAMVKEGGVGCTVIEIEQFPVPVRSTV